MVQPLALIDRLVGHVGAQLLKHVLIHRGEDHRGVHLRAPEAAEGLHGQLCRGVGNGAHGKGNEHFVGVQPGIAVAQVGHLQMLDRRKHRGRNEIHLVGNPGQMLQRIEQRRTGGAHQRRSLAGDDAAVGELNGHGRFAGALGHSPRRGHGAPPLRREIQRLHQNLHLVDLARGGQALLHGAGCGKVPPDNLLAGGLAADLVVHDGIARHVDIFEKLKR